MEAFIQQAAASLGINEDTARSATGNVLDLIKSQGDSSAVDSLLHQLPGASALLSGGGASGGGGLGGMLGGLGGGLGAGAGMLSALAGSGLDMSQLSKLAAMLVDYAKQHASPELVDKVLASVPQLRAMLA